MVYLFQWRAAGAISFVAWVTEVVLTIQIIEGAYAIVEEEAPNTKVIPNR